MDDLHAGLPPVQERLKAMKKDVEQKAVDLALCLNDQTLIPSSEKNTLL